MKLKRITTTEKIFFCSIDVVDSEMNNEHMLHAIKNNITDVDSLLLSGCEPTSNRENNDNECSNDQSKCDVLLVHNGTSSETLVTTKAEANFNSDSDNTNVSDPFLMPTGKLIIQ